MEINNLEKEALQIRDHARRLKVGVDIFRNIEFSLASILLKPSTNNKILDIGCGESIFPTYISKYYASTLTVTDILDVEEIQKKYYHNAEITSKYGESFFFKKEDATNLSFSDETFDSCYAISSIEHIPNNGDMQSIQEIIRVLKPGGIAVVAVPFYVKYLEQEYASYYGGFERRYDIEALERRLLTHTKNASVETYFLNNKFYWLDEFSSLWYSEKLYEPVKENSWQFTKALFSISETPCDKSRGVIIKFVKS